MKKILILLSMIFLFISCEDKKESGVIPYTIVNTEPFGEKFQCDIAIDFVNNEIPNVDQMKKVAEKIQKEHPEFKNYFFNFQFPFTDESESRNEYNFVSYYLLEKLDGNSDFRPVPHYNLIPENKITLNKEVVGHLGINMITNISPISTGMKLSEVEEKLGKPSIVHEKEVEYYIVNEKYQILGILFVQHSDSLVKVANFFPLRLNISKEQLSEIDAYIAGNKKFTDLNIKELKDIY
ncbi:hypothetical protein [Fusobacterium necrophorum]|uniref:hypothetical protein n=1 Tax=Fusobacterium necrophorum TaxID=859 RepID=UPI00370F7361